MFITKQEASFIAKGLTLPPSRMEEIAVYCAKDGQDAMTLGRHGVYFALGDAFNVSIAQRIIEALPNDDSLFDISGYKDSITAEVAFAALRKHLDAARHKDMSTQPDLATIRASVAQHGTDFDAWCDRAIDSTFTPGKPLTRDEAEARLVFTVVLLGIASCAECCTGTVCAKHAASDTEERLLAPARKLIDEVFAPVAN